MVIAVTFWMGANGVSTTYSAAFLIQSYSLTTFQLAPFLSVMAVGQLIGILVGGPLADRFSKARTCAITQALTGLIGMIFMLFAQNLSFSLFLGGLFLGLANASRPIFFH